MLQEEKLNLPKALVIKHCTTWGIFIFSHFDSVHSPRLLRFLNHLISSLSLIYSKRKERDLLDTWDLKYITEIKCCIWVNFNVKNYGLPSGNWKVQRCSKTENPFSLARAKAVHQSDLFIFVWTLSAFLLVLPAGVEIAIWRCLCCHPDPSHTQSKMISRWTDLFINRKWFDNSFDVSSIHQSINQFFILHLIELQGVCI